LYKLPLESWIWETWPSVAFCLLQIQHIHYVKEPFVDKRILWELSYGNRCKYFNTNPHSISYKWIHFIHKSYHTSIHFIQTDEWDSSMNTFTHSQVNTRSSKALGSCMSYLPNWSTSREVRITSLDFEDLIPEQIFIREEWKEQQGYNKGQT